MRNDTDISLLYIVSERRIKIIVDMKNFDRDNEPYKIRIHCCSVDIAF